ncbi:chromosome 6 open reading frame 123, isoform CRA_a [Homo sapiens]
MGTAVGPHHSPAPHDSALPARLLTSDFPYGRSCQIEQVKYSVPDTGLFQHWEGSIPT